VGLLVQRSGLQTPGSRGCTPALLGAEARRAGLPLAPKAGQTLHQVIGAWGAGRGAWLAQHPGLTAQAPGVCSPKGRASNQTFGACSLTIPPTKQCNPRESTRNLQ